MNPRLVPEIRDAIDLLEGYERASLTYDSARQFAVAIQTLEDYLLDNPEPPHRQFILNLRLSYTRSMLRRLARIDKADARVSLQHILLVVVTVKREAEKLMDDYPDLKKDFDALMEVWAKPLALALLEDSACTT